MSTSRSLSFFPDRVNGCPQQSQNNNPRNRFSLPIRAGQRCPARIFALLGRTGKRSRLKQPPRKSAQCPKAAHRIWRNDAIFLLATESEMCYNIPMKTSTATVPTEKPGSTTSRAVIMTPALVVLLMRIPLLLRGTVLLDTTCLHTVAIIL